jgi:hypothetical protein
MPSYENDNAKLISFSLVIFYIMISCSNAKEPVLSFLLVIYINMAVQKWNDFLSVEIQLENS